MTAPLNPSGSSLTAGGGVELPGAAVPSMAPDPSANPPRSYGSGAATLGGGR